MSAEIDPRDLVRLVREGVVGGRYGRCRGTARIPIRQIKTDLGLPPAARRTSLRAWLRYLYCRGDEEPTEGTHHGEGVYRVVDRWIDEPVVVGIDPGDTKAGMAVWGLQSGLLMAVQVWIRSDGCTADVATPGGLQRLRARSLGRLARIMGQHSRRGYLDVHACGVEAARVSHSSRELRDDESWRGRAMRHHHGGVLASGLAGDVSALGHHYLTPAEWRNALDVPATGAGRHTAAVMRAEAAGWDWPTEARDVLRVQDAADAACIAEVTAARCTAQIQRPTITHLRTA